MPPPFGCEGGDSSVRPLTVTLHGGAPAPAAVQVVASPTGPTPATSTDVMGRRSATPPPGLGNVVTSIIRNRRRVTLPPVVFVTRRRTSSVQNVELLPGLLVKSRTRFGDAEDGFVESSSGTPMPEVSRRIGL